jgi:acyl carrier protein
MSDPKAEVRAFIVDNFLFGAGDGLEDSTLFLDEGIIDSTGILELVLFLEETYDIRVDDADVVPENFESLNAVGSYLQRRVA